MFLDFFYTLRSYKIPVSTREYLDLLNVLKTMAPEEELNLDRLYAIARATLVKDIKHYDSYDLAFAQSFKHLMAEGDFKDKLSEWLNQAVLNELSDERKMNAMKLPPEELIKELEKRLKEQQERHDKGNHWIGTGGTSAFGHSGFNSQGIRIGGQGNNRSALVVAGQREFQDYRTDTILEVRQLKVALKKLRLLKHSGKATLNINETIKKTCANAGEIELVETKKRKNHLKLVLLMDVGGSMTPHSIRVNQLFSAAHQMNHFKEFKHFYFHNIFYDELYKTANLDEDQSLALDKFIDQFSPDTRIIIVGDAAMAPYELFQMTGQMRDYYFYLRERKTKSLKTGLQRVEQLVNAYKHIIWLNPEPKNYWGNTTIKAIAGQIAMFELTVDGIESGLKKLI